MITFELVSPERKLFSAPVTMVTLPGVEGDFGVLEGHAPFISTMRVGIIDIFEKPDSPASRRVMVSGGLVEVNPERCTVLAEDATPLESLSIEGMQTELQKQQDLLGIAENDESRDAIEGKIMLLRKKIDVFAVSAGH